MTPRDLIRQAALRFQAFHIPDPTEDAALLLAYLTGRDALSLRLDMDTVLEESLLDAYAELCRKREVRTPLQYLTGVQSFWNRDFHVDSRVLIPRPETELLAELGIRAIREKKSPVALDLCSGSGCIGITLAAECPEAEVHLSDLSKDALDVAMMNARTHHVEPVFHQGDLFQPLAGLRFDLIISNPPYIPSAECPVLQEEVLLEPAMALDGGKDGLDFYRRIAMEAPDHLHTGGTLLMEVGWDQAENVGHLLEVQGFHHITIHKDLSGIDRMVEGHR